MNFIFLKNDDEHIKIKFMENNIECFYEVLSNTGVQVSVQFTKGNKINSYVISPQKNQEIINKLLNNGGTKV